MKNTWLVTDHNSFEIKDTFAGHPWHVWIGPRQNYCDRGHWDWGSTGLCNASREPEPSYYFMSLQTALLEIEEYVFRAHNGMPTPTAARSLPEYDPATWVVKKSDGSYNHMRNTPQGGLVVTVSPMDSETGPVWVADIEGIDSLDHSDAFPRVYMHKESALSEMERFLKWRLEKSPFENASDRAEMSRHKIETQGLDPLLQYGEHLRDLVTKNIESKPKTQVLI